MKTQLFITSTQALGGLQQFISALKAAEETPDNPQPGPGMVVGTDSDGNKRTAVFIATGTYSFTEIPPGGTFIVGVVTSWDLKECSKLTEEMDLGNFTSSMVTGDFEIVARDPNV